MKTCDREVRVTQGQRLIHVWPCPEITLPDGSAGVLWRGVAFKLLEGDRIDVSVPATEETAQNQLCAFVPGDDVVWVLVPGTATRLHAVRQRLQDVGVAVRRYGRWMGEASAGAVFDWFLCCDGPVDTSAIRCAIEHLSVTQDQPIIQRMRALQERADALRAEAARASAAKVAAHRITSAKTIPPPDAPAIPLNVQTLASGIPPGQGNEIGEALLDALSQIKLLKAQLEATTRRAPANLPMPAIRLMDELRASLAATRPDVILLRDSWQVLAGEFRSRDGFWRTVQELPSDGSRPNGWKSFRGAERWWERHVSNGQDDTGRAYARFDTATRRWGVLLGSKGAQDLDMAWLKRQG